MLFYLHDCNKVSSWPSFSWGSLTSCASESSSRPRKGIRVAGPSDLSGSMGIPVSGLFDRFSLSFISSSFCWFCSDTVTCSSWVFKRKPNGRVLSTNIQSRHLMPSRGRSSGWTGMLRYALLISIFARICNQRIAGLGGTSVPHAMCPVLGVWLFAVGRVGVAWPALVCSYPALAAGKWELPGLPWSAVIQR